MRIVLAYRTLSQFAGSELYLVTVAEQLQLLGHDVVLYAHELGPVAELARGRGLVVTDAEAPPESSDALLAQDGELAYELAGRFPAAARLFVCHSTEFAAQSPPLAAGTCHAAVALNDRVAEHLRAAPALDVLRLRQPVDVMRLTRIAPPHRAAPRVVVFGHDHAGEQLQRIARVCERLGFDLERAGGRDRTTPGPESALAGAEIAIGIGRCVIEAMAARRAAYVSGVVGTDGWVTPESYAALEADGFSGRASGGVLSEERLERDLEAWSPALGEQGKDLAFANHDAAAHARELVALWRTIGVPADGPPAETAELTRLTRIAARHERVALENAAEAARQQARGDDLRMELHQLRTTRRYLLASRLTRPLDGLRRLASRRGRHD